MLDFVRNLFNRFFDNIAETTRQRELQQEANRLERLYGPRPRQFMPEPLELHDQANRLAAIVQQHCDFGSRIASAHATAAMKLDVAEYSFSSMLDELRGVMTSLPSDWAPQRVGIVPTLATSADAQARAA